MYFIEIFFVCYAVGYIACFLFYLIYDLLNKRSIEKMLERERIEYKNRLDEHYKKEPYHCFSCGDSLIQKFEFGKVYMGHKCKFIRGNLIMPGDEE